MKHSITLVSPSQGYQAFSHLWQAIKQCLAAGQRLVVKVEPEKRTDPQNKRLWAMLTDISQQVEWHGVHLSPEDWKCIFSAAMRKARIVPGIDGGFVVLGLSTSKMTKAEMSEMQEMMEAFAAEREVKFKEQE